MPEREYGTNVGQFLKDHPGHAVCAGPQGSGYVARPKDSRSRGRGSPVSALTLDELDAKLDDPPDD